MVYCGDFVQLEPVGRCSVHKGGSSHGEEDREDGEKEDVEEQLVKKVLDYLSPYVAT